MPQKVFAKIFQCPVQRNRWRRTGIQPPWHLNENQLLNRKRGRGEVKKKHSRSSDASSCNFASLLEAMKTLKPALANCNANSRPMPSVAPVTTLGD